MNNSQDNVLPYEGGVFYFPKALSADYFDKLSRSLDWKAEELIMFGKKIITRRLSAWYSDGGLSYTYAGLRRNGLPFSAELQELKSIAEELAKADFNSVLANYYHDGADGMGWHTDAEKELDPNTPILSMSFGAARRFSFRHKATKERMDLMLESGSALLMDAASQRHWQHSLPKALKVKEPRINLTFRQILY